MKNSLISELPKIVEEGRKEVEKILEKENEINNLKKHSILHGDRVKELKKIF